jgi:hypothetical protein
MTEVTGYTAARMQEIEDSAIVDGNIVGDNLILTRYDGTTIDAGNVRGAVGPPGSTGDTAIAIVTSVTRPASPFEGQFIYETDTNYVYSWDGAAWIYRGGTVVCTVATIPTSPPVGMSIYVSDTGRHYVWNGTTWIYTDGVIICTSVTRPTISLFAGMMIYELNTNKLLIYNGTAWVSPKNIPGGVLGYVKRETSLYNLPTTGTDILSVTVNVDANRYIKITAQTILGFSGVATDAIGTINEGATELQRFAQMSTSLNQSMGSVILNPTAGSHTYKIRVYGVGDMIYLEAATTRPTFLLVEDIGGA